MTRDKLSEVLAMGINLLNGRDSTHLTVTQVANIANAYRDATKGPAFQYPDYTIEVYSGNRDGWKLSRYPNKAGILTRIKHADVVASISKREREKKVEDMCRAINEKFMAAVESGRNPAEDAEFLAATEEYKAFCRAEGLA